MMKKILSFVLCLCMFFSARVTVSAESSYRFEKESDRYSVLTGEVTKVSPGRIKLSKISDDLWSENVGGIKDNGDYIILDTTDFEEKEFSDGDTIRAYFKSYPIDYRTLKDDHVFPLLDYVLNDEQISVEKMADFLKRIGVLKGYEDGKLHLERSITRAEFTTLMVNAYHSHEFTFMCEENIEGETIFPFKDVPKDHWARKYIEYAYSSGIISGKDKETFAPDESITIRDCIVALLHANIEYGYQRQQLLDTAKKLGGYPNGYLIIAKENEILKKELPEKIASRGDIAIILYNAHNHKSYFLGRSDYRKPVIYLYPEKETDVNVKVSFDGDFTFTYPQYDGGWNVTAKPDGTLISKTGEYPYLFWEGKTTNYSPKFDEGFLVSREGTVSFLEEKLKILGLNEKERADFITYWAPQMIKNDFNIIKFDTEEYASKVSLNIEPKPDSIIRVFMVYRAAAGNESIKEQNLERGERKGFTAVEWGGAIKE